MHIEQFVCDTVENEALSVVSGIVSIDLLAEEIIREWEKKRTSGKDEGKNVERKETFRLWQQRWDESRKGVWTKELI